MYPTCSYACLKETGEINNKVDVKCSSVANLVVTNSKQSDLRMYSSPRQQQFHSNSCAAQSIVKAAEVKRIHKFGHSKHVDLSRLMVYYLARELMNPPKVSEDKGSHISYNAEALRRFGVCEEKYWAWDLKKINVSPSWRAMSKAHPYKITTTFKINSKGNDRVDQVINTLANGYPIVFATAVGDNWNSYTSKSDPLTLPSKETGNHATVLLGWNPEKQVFYGENSWGISWGVKPDFNSEWENKKYPEYVTHGGYYEMRPEVIASTESYDFVFFKDGWQ